MFNVLITSLPSPLFPGGRNLPVTDLYDDNDPSTSSDWRSGVRRLFEGEIEGVESVAVTSLGKLVLLDKYGYVHVAEKMPRKKAKRSDPKLDVGPTVG
jgi:hypothetical protein